MDIYGSLFWCCFETYLNANHFPISTVLQVTLRIIISKHDNFAIKKCHYILPGVLAY